MRKGRSSACRLCAIFGELADAATGRSTKKHRRMPANNVTRRAAKAKVAAVVVVAVAFGLWKVHSIVILLLLALTFAAAIRPGVEWLHPRRVPPPLAIFFFAVALGAIGLFFWLAV